MFHALFAGLPDVFSVLRDKSSLQTRKSSNNFFTPKPSFIYSYFIFYLNGLPCKPNRVVLLLKPDQTLMKDY